jgi:predicted helicase
VYERFFQGFAVKTADVLGIVYTPQEIVDFMGAAVEEVLVQDFGLSLAHPDVHIIDPCTGTGGFVVNLLKRLDERHKPALRDVYAHRLFANEVALMPYYIAALNIEQTYRDLTGEYAPFEGLCLVDTLGLADDDGKLALFAEENTERIQRQRNAPITVIIGNPPYNVGQQNENDNNKNRKYKKIDQRVRESYAKDSKATNKNALSDAYVKFWRWATDRLAGRDGVVVYVTNNSFADQIAFDGMRKHLLQDFTHVYHLDLHGNVRQNPKLSGTTHNVFGIQVGVGVTVAVKSARHTEKKLFYHRVPELWTAGQKLAWIADHVEREGRENSLNTIPWTMLTPDAKNNWRVAENADEFSGFIAMGTKEGKAAKGLSEPEVLFKSYSNGVKTNRDDSVYDFDQNSLLRRMERFTEVYNSHVDKFKRQPNNKNIDIDDFVDYSAIKWDGSLKDSLIRGMYGLYNPKHARTGLYRPFSKKNFYFDRLYINRVYLYPAIFPSEETEKENRVICVSGLSSSKPFQTLISNAIPSLDTLEKTQCFPFYVYDEDGGNRRENITDWALRQFQAHYADPSISKWDIFYYVYALLHHPDYRARYQGALKKELPRIPFVPDFQAFARIGKALAELHLNYETAAPYPLTETWASGRPADWRVEKMRFNKAKTELVVNPSLTLSGFPVEAFAYTLGGRSALDWVVEQYQVKTDARSGIISDPNRYSDDEKYIVDLVKRVTTVSVETVRLVGALPGLVADNAGAANAGAANAGIVPTLGGDL